MASHQNLEIVSSNTTSDGTLSFRDGQPVIQFIIGEQERYLLGHSLRLVGNFAVKNGATIPNIASEINMDGRTSLYSTIDQLVIKSQATNQTIEHIRNYNRFMASYLTTTNDLGDGLSHLNESGLQVLNSTAVQIGVVDNQTNLGVSNSFALSLPCGFLNGTTRIPLAQGWGVGGLIVEIHLAPDNNVFYAVDGATDISDAFYQYKNLTLCCEVERPAPEQLSSLRSQGASGNTFEYNSISSYYTTINSSNAIINFSLGLSRVLSVFCNFITSQYINNRNFNGMTTWYPTNGGATAPVAKINQVIFTRGGERLPLEYNIDTLQRNEPLNRIPDAQIIRNYVNAIQSFPKNTRNLLKPENNIITNKAGAGSPSYYQTLIDGGAGVGVGVAFDSISNQGLDFTNTNFGLNMDLDLNTDNPQSVYMFVHSKRTLVFNSNGIQVIN